MRFVLLVFLVSSFVFGQDQNEKFVTAPFEKGMPKEIFFNWENASYSEIDIGEFYKSLYIVSRDSFKTNKNCSLFLITQNRGFIYNDISFVLKEKKIYEASIPLTTQEKDTLSPLKLILNLDEKRLQYRWENKKTAVYEYPTIIEEYKLKVGEIFPQIEVETAKGTWSNKKKNKIIVINWWATSCLPCIEEMPGLNQLVEKYPKDKVEFIAIVWDKKNHAKFISKHKFSYLQGFGNQKLSRLFGVAFPQNIILNKDGEILYNHVGGSKDTHLELEKIIDGNL
ncbi:MAG: TlpA disulfide reductase family protein [Ignavibacteriaceae bacterium]